MRIRIAMLVIILIFLSFICFGVDVYLGLMQGLNVGMQYMSDSELNHYGAIIGFNGGIQTDIVITDLISVEADVLVSVRGGKMKDADLSEEIKLTYIDIPVLFKLSKNIGFSILQLKVGTEVSFNLKGYWFFEDNGRNIDLYELNTRIIDLGGVVGGSMVFPVKNYYFSVELRNTIGILPPFADVSNRNLQFALLLSYGFKI